VPLTQREFRHPLLSVNYLVAASSVLGAGLALFLLAQWRGWQPSLFAALAVGAALRAGVWYVAAAQSWQPYDFKTDFHAAAVAVLHHHDPLLSGRPRGWPFLPTMAFVFAGELQLGRVAHLPWPVVGRIAPVAADLVLIALIGKLASQRGRLRRFQYACNPLPILICAVHGQLEPEVLALGVAALIVARSHRATAAGTLLGLSVAVGSWSLLLAPGVLLVLPGWRNRIRAACVMAGVPLAFLVTSPLTVGTPVTLLPKVVGRLVGLRAVIGNWGWTVVVTRGVREFVPSVGRVGVLALIIALAVAAYLWRRADPVDLTAALLITFLVVSPRVSVQYLVWPLPFLAARPTRFTNPVVIAASAWEWLGYLVLGPARGPAWMHDSMWYTASWPVITLLILAMPWDRRGRGDAPRQAEAMPRVSRCGASSRT
jgi:Glycosyltransferase family 87